MFLDFQIFFFDVLGKNYYGNLTFRKRGIIREDFFGWTIFITFLDDEEFWRIDFFFLWDERKCGVS
jgi:hypothetical protein